MTNDISASDEKKITETLRASLQLPGTPPSHIAHAHKQERERDRASIALKRAETAARRGDAAEAKRWSEIARTLAEAARTLAEAPPPMDDPEEEERLRAQLRARLGAHINAEHELRAWEMRKEIWDEMAAMARAQGLPEPPPMPLRPPHWTDDLPDDLRAAIRARDAGS
ncbi:MAG: hypothetical protein ABL883_01725 [Terricaulis sp.]